MIAEMKKLNLAAMSYDREKVLNALQRTGAAEVKCHTPVESVSPLPFAGDERGFRRPRRRLPRS